MTVVLLIASYIDKNCIKVYNTVDIARGGVRRLALDFRKEVLCMPVTFTFHVGKFTFTIHIKFKK